MGAPTTILARAVAANPNERHDHEADGFYVRWFWLPLIGPTAHELLMLLHERAGIEAPVELGLEDDIARPLGVAAHRAWHAFRGLERFRLIEHADGYWKVPATVRGLTEREVLRLPRAIRDLHPEVTP